MTWRRLVALGALVLARARGALVTGLDASESLTAIARERLEAYVQRSLARSLDRGYVAALCLKGPERARHLARLAELVRTVRPTGLRSLALYRVLERLPAALAAPVLGMVVQLKQARVKAGSRHGSPGQGPGAEAPTPHGPIAASSP